MGKTIKMSEIGSKVVMTSMNAAKIIDKMTHKRLLEDIESLIAENTLKKETHFILHEGEDRYYDITSQGVLNLANTYDRASCAKLISEWTTIVRQKFNLQMPDFLNPAVSAWVYLVNESALEGYDKPAKLKIQAFDRLAERKTLIDYEGAAIILRLSLEEFMEKLIDDDFIDCLQRMPLDEESDLFVVQEDYLFRKKVLITPKGMETFKLLYS